MKTTIMLLGTLMIGGVGCGSSSPEGFIKAQARIGCRALKKCEEADWKESGYDNVAECVDESTPEDAVEAFADLCGDFDKKAARQCLAGARKAKRKCDEDAASTEQKEACGKVCGELQIGELGRDPGDLETIRAVSERLLQRADELYEDEPAPVRDEAELAASYP